MAYQSVFKRYELKYLLTMEQKQAILAAMRPHMALDQYGRTTVRSLYFDTDNYRLIRSSISKPAYKEKLRLRSYAQAAPDSAIFVELKKKYRSVVYKRRIAMPERDAVAWLCREQPCPIRNQISAEIDYFLDFYETLHPTMLLSYQREAFYSTDIPGFRVTFDDTILCQQEKLSLEAEIFGTPILPEGRILMEIKCAGGMPLWMAHALSANHICKSSFSKYGTAYKTLIHPKRLEVSYHA